MPLAPTTIEVVGRDLGARGQGRAHPRAGHVQDGGVGGQGSGGEGVAAVVGILVGRLVGAHRAEARKRTSTVVSESPWMLNVASDRFSSLLVIPSRFSKGVVVVLCPAKMYLPSNWVLAMFTKLVEELAGLVADLLPVVRAHGAVGGLLDNSGSGQGWCSLRSWCCPRCSAHGVLWRGRVALPGPQ